MSSYSMLHRPVLGDMQELRSGRRRPVSSTASVLCAGLSVLRIQTGSICRAQEAVASTRSRHRQMRNLGRCRLRAETRELLPRVPRAVARRKIASGSARHYKPACKQTLISSKNQPRVPASARALAGPAGRERSTYVRL